MGKRSECDSDSIVILYCCGLLIFYIYFNNVLKTLKSFIYQIFIVLHFLIYQCVVHICANEPLSMEDQK